ncbi:MAG: GxxExxY protein [Paludibacteraceae bacterium]|nr:GxxExxY protein [Paludibacteraceae bacterium]
MTDNELTYAIRGAAFKVHATLGPGLLESLYQKALYYELLDAGYNVRREVAIPILYNGHEIGNELKMDLLVEDRVIIELKSVDTLTDLHKKQLLSYLRLADKKLGLLINFNATSLDEKSVIRIIN